MRKGIILYTIYISESYSIAHPQPFPTAQPSLLCPMWLTVHFEQNTPDIHTWSKRVAKRLRDVKIAPLGPRLYCFITFL